MGQTETFAYMTCHAVSGRLIEINDPREIGLRIA